MEAVAHRILIAGIGPGHPDYILPAARQAISSAKVLVGGRRALEGFAHDGQRQIPITKDIASVIGFIREELASEDVVVMVSGDPGYYSMLDALRKEFPRERLQVIPGISSLQMAFAKLALPWHGARLLSFHGRQPEERELFYEKGAVLGMLTDGSFDSHRITVLLMEKGWPKETRLAVCARLSYEDERIVETTLEGALEMEEIKHGILIVQG